MAPAPDITAGSIWQSVLTTLRLDFWALFAIAAPFTLLVDMALAQFGPPQPQTVEELTPRVMVILVLIPSLIGAIAQLAVARMVALPDASPRAALAAALRVFPAFVAVLLLGALPTGLGVLMFIIPGVYVAARLYLVVPVAVLEPLGPIEVLQRSWALTAGRGWTIAWFLILSILLLIGASLLAAGVGGALGSVLTLIGLKPVGVFAANLVNAVLACVFSIGTAVAATEFYQRLR